MKGIDNDNHGGLLHHGGMCKGLGMNVIHDYIGFLTDGNLNTSHGKCSANWFEIGLFLYSAHREV